MKLFFGKLFGLSLSLFFFVTTSGMQQQKKLASLGQGAGCFDVLPKEIRYPLLAGLSTTDWNVLRKTCKALSRVFSFYEPSDIILHKNSSVARKDVAALFAVSVFDGHYQVVEELCKRYGPTGHDYWNIDSSCKFSKIGEDKLMCSGIGRNKFMLNPYVVAFYNNDKDMMKSFEKYRFTDLTLHKYTEELPVKSNIFNLFTACLSRNTERIVATVTDFIGQVGPNTIENCVLIIIDNDDAQSLAAIIDNQKINEYVKEKGYNLLNLAIFGRHDKVVEVLIKSRCFDLNDFIRERLDEDTYYEGTYLDLINCCRDIHMFPLSLFNLLKEHKAKTTDELMTPKAMSVSVKKELSKIWSSLFVWFISQQMDK